MIRPDHAFLARAATRERAILSRHIGHPCGVLHAVNNNQPGYDPLDDPSHPFPMPPIASDPAIAPCAGTRLEARPGVPVNGVAHFPATTPAWERDHGA